MLPVSTCAAAGGAARPSRHAATAMARPPERRAFIIGVSSLGPKLRPRPLNVVERPIVEIESEMPRAEHLEAFRRPPHRRIWNADHHDIGTHRIRPEALAENRVAGLRVEVADQV